MVDGSFGSNLQRFVIIFLQTTAVLQTDVLKESLSAVLSSPLAKRSPDIKRSCNAILTALSRSVESLCCIAGDQKLETTLYLYICVCVFVFCVSFAGREVPIEKHCAWSCVCKCQCKCTRPQLECVKWLSVIASL